MHKIEMTQTRKKGYQLFNDNPRGKPRLTTLGYGTKKKALNSVKKLKKMNKAYQRQAATTMYYRAKYHKYRTKNMKQSMKVYKKFLNSIKQKGGATRELKITIYLDPFFQERVDIRNLSEERINNLLSSAQEYVNDQIRTQSRNKFLIPFNLDNGEMFLRFGRIQGEYNVQFENFPKGSLNKILEIRLEIAVMSQNEKYYIKFSE
jgi:hypothetical protein